MITARIKLSRKKAPIKTRRVKKMMGIAGIEASMSEYMILVQPSSVITWKSVIMAMNKLSKEV